MWWSVWRCIVSEQQQQTGKDCCVISSRQQLSCAYGLRPRLYRNSICCYWLRSLARQAVESLSSANVVLISLATTRASTGLNERYMCLPLAQKCCCRHRLVFLCYCSSPVHSVTSVSCLILSVRVCVVSSQNPSGAKREFNKICGVKNNYCFYYH